MDSTYSPENIEAKWYQHWLDTRAFEPSGEGTLQGKKQSVSDVVVRFYKSRLPLIGPNSAQLSRMHQRDDEAYGSAISLLSGDKPWHIKSSWRSNGRIFFRQDRPLPTTILAVIPDVLVGDEDGEADDG